MERTVELSAGTIAYGDTGGDGPPVVMLHGLMMDGSLWDAPAAELSSAYRCLTPTLPLGAHRAAMRPDADLSLPGVARLVAEFLERLDLSDVTLVGNDTGGAVVQAVVAEGLADRVGRIVLASCEAFDNIPPGLTGRTLALAGRLSPGAFGLFMQQMRLRPVRRLPIAFGRLTRVGDEATAHWMRPVLTRPEIRRDTVRMLRAVLGDRQALVHAAEKLPSFDRPALVVWADRDRVMPPEHGRRLAELLPRGRLVEIPYDRTLLALDRPLELAAAISDFASDPASV